MRRLRDLRKLVLGRPDVALLLAFVSLLLCGVSGGVAWYAKYAVVEALQRDDSRAARDALAYADFNAVLARLDALGEPSWVYYRALDALFGITSDGEYHAPNNDIRVETVQSLVARGAKPAYKHLMAAVSMDNLPVALYLLANGVPARGVAGERSTLVEAARQGDDRLAVALIERGADVNAPDGTAYYDGKWRPLFVAVSNSKVAVIRVLLEHGADPTALQSYGEQAMPIWEAVREQVRNRRGTAMDDDHQNLVAAWELIKPVAEKHLGHPIPD